MDTNVLVYAVDQADPVKRDTAQDLLASAEGDLVLSTQVLGEFYVTATRKLEIPLPPSEAGRAVERLAELPTVVVDLPLVLEAIRIHAEAQLSYWDGLIVAAAQRAGCSQLVTEDLQDGRTVGGVGIVDPFRSVG